MCQVSGNSLLHCVTDSLLRCVLQTGTGNSLLLESVWYDSLLRCVSQTVSGNRLLRRVLQTACCAVCCRQGMVTVCCWRVCGMTACCAVCCRQLPLAGRVRVLDVGSCYNPFLQFPEFLAVGLDISPATQV